MSDPSSLNRPSIIPKKSGLRQYYRLTFTLGVCISLGLITYLFNLPLHPTTTFEIPIEEVEFVVKLEEVEQTQQVEKPPPPPRPPIPIEVPNDIVLEDEPLDFDAEIDFEEVADLPPPPLPPPPEPEEEIEEPEIFLVVEEPPELIGGFAELQKQVVYPEIALKAGVTGTVVVQFVIDEEGRVTDPKVVREVGGGCDEEALRVVKLARFKPGRQRGRAVKVKYAIPIRFKLKPVAT